MEYLLYQSNFSTILIILLLLIKGIKKDILIHTMTLKMLEKIFITHLALLLLIRAPQFILQLKHIAIV